MDDNIPQEHADYFSLFDLDKNLYKELVDCDFVFTNPQEFRQENVVTIECESGQVIDLRVVIDGFVDGQPVLKIYSIQHPLYFVDLEEDQEEEDGE